MAINLVLTLLLSFSCKGYCILFFSFILKTRLFWNFATLRFVFFDVIFDFVKSQWISFDAIIIVVDKILLKFAFPRTPTNHIEVDFVGLFKFLISFETMFLKSVSSPWENLIHTRVFSSTFGRLAKSAIWEVYFARLFPHILIQSIFHKSINILTLKLQMDENAFSLLFINL